MQLIVVEDHDIPDTIAAFPNGDHIPFRTFILSEDLDKGSCRKGGNLVIQGLDTAAAVSGQSDIPEIPGRTEKVFHFRGQTFYHGKHNRGNPKREYLVIFLVLVVEGIYGATASASVK